MSSKDDDDLILSNFSLPTDSRNDPVFHDWFFELSALPMHRLSPYLCDNHRRIIIENYKLARDNFTTFIQTTDCRKLILKNLEFVGNKNEVLSEKLSKNHNQETPYWFLNKKAANFGENISNILKSPVVYNWREGYKYEIRFNTSESTVVNILNVVSGKKADWVIRLDQPYGKCTILDKPHHININKTFSGIPDPHIKLSPTKFKVCKNTAYVAKCIGKMQKILIPISVGLDIYYIAVSAKEDYKKKTFRNSVSAIGNSSAGWFGSYGGAVIGATIGSFLRPVVGTILGTIVGSVGGAFFVPYIVDYGINKIADKFDYDTTDVKKE